MRKPEIENCPCCGAKIRITDDVATISSWTVEPKCIHVTDASVVMIDCVLIWRCRICGCEWRHGQFAETIKES